MEKIVGRGHQRSCSSKVEERQARKRMQDREAQRNMRRRTRDHIARLEARLAELEAPDCIAQLLQENETLQKQNQKLMGSLKSISSMVHLVVSEDLSEAAEEGAAKPANTAPSITTAQDQSDPCLMHTSQKNLDEGFNLPESFSGMENLLLPRGDDSQQNTEIDQCYFPPSIPVGQVSRTRSAVEQVVLPQIYRPSNFWDEKLFYFIEEQRDICSSQLIAHSLGQDGLNVSLLTDPTCLTGDGDPICRFLAKFVNQWNFKLPERIGIFWLNYIYLNYRIHPSTVTFQNLPDWYAPRPGQSVVPHPIYVDTIPWPRLRTKLAFEYKRYHFKQFLDHFCISLNVNWGHGAASTYVVDANGSVHISPEFERHIRKLENWSLKPSFACAYPDLVAEVTIQ